MTIDNLLRLASKELKQFDRPRLEAEILLSSHLSLDRVSLHLNSQLKIKEKDLADFWKLISRRKSFEPIEYITNRVSFYSEYFFIDKGALIPRPETELLVDEASKIIKKLKIESIAEIGVGSGIVSIILSKLFPNIKIYATDISSDALKIAQKNLFLHNLNDKVELIHSPFLDEVIGKIDLIVSNPPYISKNAKLEPNIINFEPKEALFAEDNGTEVLKKITELAIDRDVKALVCEMGFDQKDIMEKFFISLKIENFGFYKDFAGLYRGFWIIFRK